ncbi:terminase small subunit [Mannheimia haemolytica]|uniref:terminase small subunit n=2 Tax=Mannheimia haemolytica TaxID=75985 RepID=UPI00201BA541|nr:terminase small subunit [Mannheimia haemolytica]MDW0618285.1 terminase small subunit [Mannheimia haemolytica]UQX70302.1 terminase small subunit [Mannheimia haemolytica]HDL1261438.1 terminase small subunit [Mannheimia haemolytica]
MTELTPKQEAFCFAYIETGNASEAYRQAYETEDMKSETVHRKAKELMDNGKITARIEELKAEHAERHKLTVDDLLAELEEARLLAKEKENPNAMTQATMGKAKLLGLDKQVIDHTSSDDSLKPQIQLTEGEFREIALELLATV